MMFVLKYLLLVLPLFLSVAYFTLLERKVLSLVGLRLGPTKVSWLGILQPITDAVKLSNKECNYISNFSLFFYYLSSSMMLLSGLLLFSCIPTSPTPISIKFSFFFIFMILSFNSLNSVVSGWSTFSKYSIMGSLRTVCQLISYEGALYLVLFFFLLCVNSVEVGSLKFFPGPPFFFTFPSLFFLWVPCYLSELNRTPYDFSEGESELVSGFNTEFGSASFTLIFLSEYSNMIFFSILSTFLFLSLSLLYVSFFLFFVLWVRSVLPRFRFDKLMYLAWKFLIPFCTTLLLFFLIWVA